MHYLDNAATTRVADAVADTADAVLRAHYANPSSLYAPGAQSEFVLSGARETVAASLGAQPGEIDPDLALFDEGLLDSFATIQMVLALEEGFGLHLEISELSREQMATPAKIARTIGGMLS